jgi:hypothetical protein
MSQMYYEKIWTFIQNRNTLCLPVIIGTKIAKTKKEMATHGQNKMVEIYFNTVKKDFYRYRKSEEITNGPKISASVWDKTRLGENRAPVRSRPVIFTRTSAKKTRYNGTNPLPSALKILRKKKSIV